MQTHGPEQLEQLYTDINRLVELAADLDDIQQELKAISLSGGKRRGLHSLTSAQNQVDLMINDIQRQINQLEGSADEISQPAT